MKNRRKKVLKVAAIAITSLLVLAAAAGIYIKSEARRIIGDEFAKLTDGRYALSVSDVRVNLLRRSVTLTDLSITPRRDSAARVADSVSVRRTHILNFSASQLFAAGIRLKDGLEIKKLKLVSPRVKVRKLQPDLVPLDTGARVRPVRIAIGQVIISDGYAEFGDGDKVRNLIEGLELRTERLLFDSGGGFRASTVGDGIKLTVRKIQRTNEDGSIRMEVDSVSVAVADRTIRIGSFALIPTYSKDQFGWKSWGHKDWQQARITGITCHGVDFGHFLADRELFIDSIHIDKGNYSSYKNRNIIRDEWVKPLYHQIIQRLPLRFAVRRSVIGSFDARYEELRAGGDTPGVITFDRIGGQIEWLSNIPFPDRTHSQWNLRAEVMGSGPLTVVGYMPIDSLNDRFEVAAVLGRMDMTQLNGMIRPLANVEIRGGTIDRLDCLITGDSHQAQVDMTFLYTDLDVLMLKERNGRIRKNLLISEIVNGIILIDSNPRQDRIRRSRQTTQRDPYRSPWNYLWRTVFGGVKETVGLGRF